MADMNPFVRGLVRAAAESFTRTVPILEVGSRLVPGQESLGSPRNYFPGRTYIGLDIQPGAGVDVVASVEALPQADASMGAVIALEVLEHVPRFWNALDELQRILAPDGILLISTPFNVQIHNHPGDYWRFTPMAWQSLLRAFPQRLIGSYGPTKRPIGTWALVFGQERTPPTEVEVAAFRQRLQQYARWPLSTYRWAQCQLGRLLFGRRYFDKHLYRDRFDYTWHQDEVADEQRKQPAASSQPSTRSQAA
jgi:SAM-dependent methyltransferase